MENPLCFITSDAGLSSLILYNLVAVGFSLRFKLSDGCMRVSRKLRNLKDAPTCPNVPSGTGGHKALRLCKHFFIQKLNVLLDSGTIRLFCAISMVKIYQYQEDVVHKF